MSTPLFLSPSSFPDYELIDSGNFEKLERFGEYVLIRPEPQALWDPKLLKGEWEKRAHAQFIPRSSSAGDWKKLKKLPDQWRLKYQIGAGHAATGQRLSANDTAIIQFRLGLTSFKHVGIFPEQAVNWEYIYESIKGLKAEKPRFLNLFAYTGGASLAAAAAGAEVTHVDSIGQVVTWANENMQLSGLKDIRWVVEDAMKFVKREVKRGNKYHGIILDPPAYGHGPAGEKWKLEDDLNTMMHHVLNLLDPEEHFLILNAYSLGLSSLVTENLLRKHGGTGLETGELYLQATSGSKLPLGIFGRFRT